MANARFYSNLSPISTPDHHDHGKMGGPLDSSLKGFELSHFHFSRDQTEVGRPLMLSIGVPDATNLPAFYSAQSDRTVFTFSLTSYREIPHGGASGVSLMLQIDGIGAQVVSVYCEDDGSEDPTSFMVEIAIANGEIRSFTPTSDSDARPQQFAAVTT